MPGLLFYADIFASWIDGLSFMWHTLQLNTSYVLNDWASNTGGPGSVILKVVNAFIYASGLGQLTLLEFILSMMGTGFMFYLGFTLVKWFFNLIT